jgi:hypothetical protein
MAFEQRAAVAENLQRFVFCHALKIKSKVQSSKFFLPQSHRVFGNFSLRLCVSVANLPRAEVD